MSYLAQIVDMIRQRRQLRRSAACVPGDQTATAPPPSFRIDWKIVFPSRAAVFLATVVGSSLALTAAWLIATFSMGTPSLVTVGLGGPPAAATTPTPAANSTPVTTEDEPVVESNAGTLAMTITYVGMPPPPRVLVRPPVGPPILDESLLVDVKTGGIANVVVQLEKVPEGWKVPPAPKSSVNFAVAGGSFVPHAIVVRTGQPVTIVNNHPAAENVRFTPFRSKAFRQNLAPGLAVNHSYDRSERVPVEVLNDYHPWMKAYHVVTDHPWVALTDTDGTFTIKGLPPGTHNFVVWHESVGYLERKLPITISAGETKEQKLLYPASKFLR